MARLPHEVKPPLPFHRPSRRLTFGRQESLTLFLGTLALADVDEQGLRVQRLSSRSANRRHLFPHPDDAAAAREQAVFSLPRCRAGRLLSGAGEHLVAVVGMQELRVELRIVLQIGRRVAEQRLDLPADVEDRAAVVRRRDHGDDRERLGQSAILVLGLVEPLGRIGEDGARGDDSIIVRNGSDGHRDDQLLPGRPRVAEVATVDALALRHSLEGSEDVRALVLGAQQGDVTPCDFSAAWP